MNEASYLRYCLRFPNQGCHAWRNVSRACKMSKLNPHANSDRRQVSVISWFSPLGGATLDGSMPNSNSFYLTTFTLHWRDWRRVRENDVRSFAHRTAYERGQVLGSAGDLPSHIMQPKNTMAKKVSRPGQNELG